MHLQLVAYVVVLVYIQSPTVKDWTEDISWKSFGTKGIAPLELLLSYITSKLDSFRDEVIVILGL